ncbi:MAG TPA: hypothetical protein VFV24_01540 [Candidatus Eisenbacteria bacterium]|nr:hypothetical protein [Candidatus Eisenbacteria bacterium]
MIRPIRIAATIALVLGLASIPLSPVRVSAHEHPSDEDRDFAWAVVRDGESNWHILDRDRIGELKRRYEQDFLYFRDETGRYVVTDPKLVDEAAEAPREIEKHRDVINSLANAEARLAMSKVGDEDDLERLRKRERDLRKQIDERERAGESTDALMEKLFHTSMERKALQGIAEDNRLSQNERAALVRQRDKAKQQLAVVERRIEDKVRSIAETAKRRGLAERLEP